MYKKEHMPLEHVLSLSKTTDLVGRPTWSLVDTFSDRPCRSILDNQWCSEQGH